MNLRLFAAEELKIALRSRWTQIFAVVFAILAAGVAAAGYVISGGHGVQDFSRTSASLVHLVVLIVPLVSLMLGVLSLSLERGAAEMVFALPVSRWTILLGRMLGLFVALALAQSFGFGLAGLLVYTQSGPEGVGISSSSWAPRSWPPRCSSPLRPCSPRTPSVEGARRRWPSLSSPGWWARCSSTSRPLASRPSSPPAPLRASSSSRAS